MEAQQRKEVEYKFLRQNTRQDVPKMRKSTAIYLTTFHVAIMVMFALFSKHKTDPEQAGQDVNKYYGMFMDIHSMMFVGFGFLMTFLKRYGYSSIGFNFIVAAYVLEWAILVRGWIGSEGGSGHFDIGIQNLFVADFCAAAVLISMGAVLGKTSLSQLIIMATIEVVVQSVNEHIGVHYLKAYDVGESMYVHVFGAYFGLAVAKVLNTNEVESSKESSHYHSDLFSMIGTLFLWLYWPSFNSATAADEGQTRAIVNTFLSISASCITTFILSTLVSKGKLNMVHIQNATLAGGVAIGTIADMAVAPFGAMIVGSVAGVVSTLGFEYLTPLLKKVNLHDTCGVNNLHGIPGIMSGIAGGIVAAMATETSFGGDRLYVFYPSRAPKVGSDEYLRQNLTSVSYAQEGLGRTATQQGGFQIAALAVSFGIAIVSGIITGFILRLPIIEQVKDEEEMFDDEINFIVPEDYSLKLTEVKVTHEEHELHEKKAII